MRPTKMRKPNPDDVPVVPADVLDACARDCAGFNEETYRMIPDWERVLWRARAKAAIDTYFQATR